MNTNPNEPICPTEIERSLYDPDDPEDIDGGFTTLDKYSGLTKREFFAAMALSAGSSAKDSLLKADTLIECLNMSKGDWHE